jgi:hypothetical protein
MEELLPKGEKIRQAVRWISENLKESKPKSIAELVQRASTIFNLSPKEEQELMAFYRTNSTAEG